MAALEAGTTPAGSIPTVTETAAGPLIVFRHADGSSTRFSSGTRFSLGPVRPGASGVVVHLESGSSWHRVGPRSDPDSYRLVLTPGTVSIDEATALLVCQPDGECFVGAVDGRIRVAPRHASPFVVQPDQVAWMPPAGDAFIVFDDMDLDELEDVSWISANVELDRALPVGRPVLEIVPRPPAVTPAPAAPRAVRGRGAAWLLVAAGVLAPVLGALLATGTI